MRTPATHRKRSLLCLPLLGLACAAQAQSSVTLYGVADAGVRYSSGLNAAYGGDAGSSTVVNGHWRIGQQ